MDTLNAFASSSDKRNSEDALKVLGRLADAFDNPSLHKTDKDLFFVVNVVKSRHLLTSPSSNESMYHAESHDSSFDLSYDEDVELVELGDVSMWEHRRSYPYASRRHQSHQPRSYSERMFHRDDGTYDITKMLLTSSPLDRLDRLARMELKKAGWIERVDKWAVVDMGLPAIPTPSEKDADVGEKLGRSSCNKMAMPMGEKHASRRYDAQGKQSPISKVHGPDTPERSQRQIKCNAAVPMCTPVYSRDSDSYPVDMSPLSYVDVPSLSYTDIATPMHAPRPSRTLEHKTPQQQAGGRLGQVVRNFVRRMLPPSSGGGVSGRPRSRRTGASGGSPSGRASHAEMTPRSNASGESGWTFASANSWMAGPAQGCLDYQTTNRWSGFWH